MYNDGYTSIRKENEMKINMSKASLGIEIAGGLVALVAAGFQAVTNYRELKHQLISDSEGFTKEYVDMQDKEDSEVEE